MKLKFSVRKFRKFVHLRGYPLFPENFETVLPSFSANGKCVVFTKKFRKFVFVLSVCFLG